MDDYNYDYSGTVAYLDRTKKPYVLREKETNRRLRFEVMEGEVLEEEFSEEEFVKAVAASAERDEAKYPGIFDADGKNCIDIFCLGAKEYEEEIIIGVTEDMFSFGFHSY